MHAISKKTPDLTLAQPGTATATARRTNRVAAKPGLKPRSTYPTLSVVQLKPGPLTRLAWLFLNTDR